MLTNHRSDSDLVQIALTCSHKDCEMCLRSKERTTLVKPPEFRLEDDDERLSTVHD